MTKVFKGNYCTNCHKRKCKTNLTVSLLLPRTNLLALHMPSKPASQPFSVFLDMVQTQSSQQRLFDLPCHTKDNGSARILVFQGPNSCGASLIYTDKMRKKQPLHQVCLKPLCKECGFPTCEAPLESPFPSALPWWLVYKMPVSSVLRAGSICFRLRPFLHQELLHVVLMKGEKRAKAHKPLRSGSQSPEKSNSNCCTSHKGGPRLL